jgi:hypothetical protein
MTELNKKDFKEQVVLNSTKHNSRIDARYNLDVLQKSFEVELEKMRKTGEKPISRKLAERVGVDASYLDNSSSAWAKKVLNDYKKLRSEWEECGGAEYKAMKKILVEMVENGEKPGITIIGEKAGRSSTYLRPIKKSAKSYPWKNKLVDEIKEAQKAFDQPVLDIPHGYVSLNCQYQPLDALVKRLQWGDAENTVYKDAAVNFNGTEVNFASWLYSRWFRVSEGKKGLAIYVDPNSLNIHRTLLIKGAVLALNEVNKPSQKYKARLIERYINWLNISGRKTPENVDQAKGSYRDYTDYLKQVAKAHDPRKKQNSVDKNNFGYSTAFTLQHIMSLVLAEAFGVNPKEVEGMTERIKGSSPNDDDKAVVDIDALNDALSYYYQFFEQVTDFLFNKRSYPHSIRLLEHDAILIPLTTPKYPYILTPYNGKKNDWRKYFDPESLELRDETGVKTWVMHTEAYERTHRAQKKVILDRTVETLKTIRTTINEANIDHFHSSRLSFGLLAMHAYFMVLLDVTGMNDSTLATMPWGDEDDLIDEKTNDSIKLKNIKHRAGDKVVEFTIQRQFKPSFISFLRLRRFVLNGHSCDTLFFTGIGKDTKLASGYRNGGFGSITCRVFQKYYPDLQLFGSRTQRQYKKRWIMKQTNGRTYLAAKLLQHTESTSQTSYKAQSKEESQNMMGNYFDYQHNVIMEVSDDEFSGSGACKTKNKVPEAQEKESAIKPDCNKKMTCLFCKHYRLKPVEQEIHKVLSMKYVIEQFSILYAWSQMHFDNVTMPILDRIEMLIEAMKVKYPATCDIIEDVRIEVEKQNLHPYWEAIHERNWRTVW